MTKLMVLPAVEGHETLSLYRLLYFSSMLFSYIFFFYSLCKDIRVSDGSVMHGKEKMCYVYVLGLYLYTQDSNEILPHTHTHRQTPPLSRGRGLIYQNQLCVIQTPNFSSWQIFIKEPSIWRRSRLSGASWS